MPEPEMDRTRRPALSLALLALVVLAGLGLFFWLARGTPVAVGIPSTAETVRR